MRGTAASPPPPPPPAPPPAPHPPDGGMAGREGGAAAARPRGPRTAVVAGDAGGAPESPPGVPKPERQRRTNEPVALSLLGPWRGEGGAKLHRKTVTVVMHDARVVVPWFKGLVEAMAREASNCLHIASLLATYVVLQPGDTPSIFEKSNGQTFVYQCISSVLDERPKKRSLVSTKVLRKFWEDTDLKRVDLPKLRGSGSSAHLMMAQRNTMAVSMVKHVKDHFWSYVHRYVRHEVRKLTDLEGEENAKKARSRAFKVAKSIVDTSIADGATLDSTILELQRGKNWQVGYEAVVRRLHVLLHPLREGVNNANNGVASTPGQRDRAGGENVRGL